MLLPQHSHIIKLTEPNQRGKDKYELIAKQKAHYRLILIKMARILIIEDEPAYRKILKDTFENEGFEVELASEGKAGIIEAAKNRPDFILLDLIMPGMSGATVLRHIGDVDGLGTVPVAVLTVVPEGVPQGLEGWELFKNIVGFWVKDQESLPELVQKVKKYLNI